MSTETSKNTPPEERPFDRRTGLGTRQEKIVGEEYEGVFTGKAYVTGDHDEGTFLSDKSFAQHSNEVSNTMQLATHGPFPERKYLDMAGLFPENWQESEVEYEITVRAKRIPPTSP